MLPNTESGTLAGERTLVDVVTKEQHQVGTFRGHVPVSGEIARFVVGAGRDDDVQPVNRLIGDGAVRARPIGLCAPSAVNRYQ